ncbi:IMS import disulfide relay-system CHCH-CHCH-like Cx9C domain-containing protein [Plasmodiophora brassicae]|uniref:IMS import disulfide relay-system CHCH-CHCH-like Cx9C domain-containing protein n=1 Tax=Plasmodiophora brassicae TaxID=37360 RepID=A0A0G4IRH0_PLABS|nr:hypothetical protein PBRA_006092 [Plasmodiophora brassicae]
MADRPPRLLRRLGTAFVQCPTEAQVYGACVLKNLDRLEKGVCEDTFQALARCVRQAVQQTRSRR